MSRRLTMGLMLVAALACGWMRAAETPDQAFGFAAELLKEGEEGFALLEFKRFAFQYPKDARASEATLRAALLYLTCAEDMDRARRTLNGLADVVPTTPAADQAKQLLAFIDVNSDFEGKPLILYLRAKAAGSREQFAKSASQYLEVSNTYPKARLGDQALLAGAKLQIGRLNQVQEGADNLQLLTTRYPNSPLAAEAMYEGAAVIEKLKGPGKVAQDAYRKVATQFPDTEFGKKAATHIAVAEKTANLPRRQYEKESVRQFQVLKEGYGTGTDYIAVIQISTEASLHDVEATMEEALFQCIEKRRTATDGVNIQAYYNYPLTQAGSVTWQPGQDPVYKLKERKTEDLIKDVFFDILKKKK
ncbi:MAG: hypothetical protein A3K19_27505 [Lentisphaerae bacterium RIFOXYB12_FULL_65_16]|nr:MAG: hypothetical protein A3K18_06350 [Lentisphaerae bacterium RIFOXYA12_64_32]OGV86459.1 MAG: hypothetical protein A3K19_27505 [Lentisphaerae bacterium RIFOXYB12_FULL_65_16]